MRTPLLLVGGWAHPAAALRPLEERLQFRFETVRTGPHELWEETEAEGPPDLTAELAGRIARMPAPPVLVGWSLGGLLALGVTVRDPGSVSALVLIGATARFCADEGYACGVPPRNLRALKLGLGRDRPGALARFFADAAYPANSDAATLGSRVEEAGRFDPVNLMAGLDVLAQADLRGDCGGLAVPALALHGREDRVIPCAAGEWLAARLARAQLKIREGCGHDLPLRDPEWVARALLAFAEGLS